MAYFELEKYRNRILETDLGESKSKVHPITSHEGTEGKYRYNSTLSLTSALAGGGGLTPRPSRFTPRNEPVLIV